MASDTNTAATTSNGDGSAPTPQSIRSQEASQPSQPTQFPSSTSELPPAALDLATKLFDLARCGTTDVLSQYLQAGIPPNLTNSSGDTLLMLASYHGHVSTVKSLLSAGADPNVLNGRGQSVIAGAIFKGYDEVVKVLFEGGADVQMGQPNAVDCARMFKKDGVLRLFGVELGEGRTVDVDGRSGNE